MKLVSNIGFITVLAMLLLACQPAKELETLQVKDLQDEVPKLNLTITDYCLQPTEERIQFYLFNRNIRIASKGAIFDLDGDGVSDFEETSLSDDLGLDPQVPDTNSDLYPDLVIYLGGFSTQVQPTLPANAALDSDKDGLSDVTELLIGTDPKKADSDGDGLLDESELRFRLSPILVDATVDTDADGLSNLEEIYWNLPLREYNNQIYIQKYKYDIIQSPINDQDGKHCYRYTIHNIPLNVMPNSNEIQLSFTTKFQGIMLYHYPVIVVDWSQLKQQQAQPDKKGEVLTYQFSIPYSELQK